MDYLFTRQRHVSPGRSAAVREWGQNITERVNAVSGLNVALFERVLSPSAGTLLFAVHVQDLGQLESMFGKLEGDADYTKAVDKAASDQMITGNVRDTLYTVIEGTLPELSTRQLQYLTTTQAITAPGQFAAANTAGIEIARQAQERTKTPVAFLSKQTDQVGGVMWISGHSSIADLQRAQTELQNEAWSSFLDDRTEGSFIPYPNESRSIILRRVQH